MKAIQRELKQVAVTTQILLFAIGTCLCFQALAAEVRHPTLPLGSPAPNFDLPGVDGRNHALAEFASAKILIVVFTCNHCPTAQLFEERIKSIVTDYQSKGIALVAISPNDPKALRLDELGSCPPSERRTDSALAFGRDYVQF